MFVLLTLPVLTRFKPYRYVVSMELCLPWETALSPCKGVEVDADTIAMLADAFECNPSLFDELRLQGPYNMSGVEGDDHESTHSSPRRQTRSATASAAQSPRRNVVVSEPDTAVSTAATSVLTTTSSSSRQDPSGELSSEQQLEAQPQLLPLRADHEAFEARVAAIFKAKYPKTSQPAPHTVGFSPQYAGEPLARENYTLQRDHLSEIKRQNATSTRPVPAPFDRAFTIGDWKTQLARFEQVAQDTSDYEQFDEAQQVYSSAAPLPFDRALALKPGHFIDNIVYNEKTYAVACRHHTMKFDCHPWCWKCYRCSKYVPCEGPEGCVHCRRMEEVARNERESKMRGDSDGDIEKVAVLLGKQHLPRRIIFQFDANAMMIIQAFDGGSIKQRPFQQDQLHQLVLHYDLRVKTFSVPRSPRDAKRKRGDRGAETEAAKTLMALKGARAPDTDAPAKRQRRSRRNVAEKSYKASTTTLETASGERMVMSDSQLSENLAEDERDDDVALSVHSSDVSETGDFPIAQSPYRVDFDSACGDTFNLRSRLSQGLNAGPDEFDCPPDQLPAVQFAVQGLPTPRMRTGRRAAQTPIKTPRPDELTTNIEPRFRAELEQWFQNDHRRLWSVYDTLAKETKTVLSSMLPRYLSYPWHEVASAMCNQRGMRRIQWGPAGAPAYQPCEGANSLTVRWEMKAILEGTIAVATRTYGDGDDDWVLVNCDVSGMRPERPPSLSVASPRPAASPRQQTSRAQRPSPGAHSAPLASASTSQTSGTRARESVRRNINLSEYPDDDGAPATALVSAGGTATAGTQQGGQPAVQQTATLGGITYDLSQVKVLHAGSSTTVTSSVTTPLVTTTVTSAAAGQAVSAVTTAQTATSTLSDDDLNRRVQADIKLQEDLRNRPKHYEGKQTLRYIDTARKRTLTDAVPGLYTTDEALEVPVRLKAGQRSSVVLLADTKQYTWDDIKDWTATQARDVLKTLMTAEGVEHAPVHSLNWYHRLAVMKHQKKMMEATDDYQFMLLGGQPLTEMANAEKVDTDLLGERYTSAWYGLSPMATEVMRTRETKYVAELNDIADDKLLSHVYRCPEMLTHAEHYVHRQSADLRIRALTVPPPGVWTARLSGTVGENFSYPVADRMMRYAEELARLRFYTLSQREHDFVSYEQRLLPLLDEVRVYNQGLASRLHDAFGGFANRSFYGLNDEYSAAAEQLSHLVTVRRQGHLVTMPSNAVLTRAALGATIIGANTIL